MSGSTITVRSVDLSLEARRNMRDLGAKRSYLLLLPTFRNVDLICLCFN
jgi:hypothetical protein